MAARDQVPLATNPVHFSKWQALGNDFILIEEKDLASAGELKPVIAQKLCDRHLGIGADQILILKKPQNPKADIRMDVINSDGSKAGMCGNGLRAVALYLARIKPKRPRMSQYQIETALGLHPVFVSGTIVSVELGAPRIIDQEPYSLEVGKEHLQIIRVDLGNPHAVIYVPDLEKSHWRELGPAIELHPLFPQQTNVAFVQVKSLQEIDLRVWERGAGATLACGSGACASVVAGVLLGKLSGNGEKILVHQRGGDLKISWKMSALPSPIIMEGSASHVFDGEIDQHLLVG